MERKGIGFQEGRAGARQNLKLVQLALAQFGHEQFPDARTRAQPHRMPPPIPAIELADDADALGIRRPHREIDSSNTRYSAGMCAQFFKYPVVVALGKQIAVLIAQN